MISMLQFRNVVGVLFWFGFTEFYLIIFVVLR